MCTHEEGMRLRSTFSKYYDGQIVDHNDKELLDKLMMASYIDYYLDEHDRLCAKASRYVLSIGKPAGC